MASEKVLAGQVALITGASRGIGLGIAERLAELGAKVSISGRDRARIDAAAAGLRKRGAEVFAAVADVTLAADATRLVEETRAALGPLDILVNNAGIGWFKPFYEFDEKEWDSILDTNLKGVFLVSRAVAPEMIRRKTGQIVNISSLSGKNTFQNGGVYCASKWGLMGLTGCMIEDLRGHGIRVSAVCPGSVATDFSPHSGRDQSKLLQVEDVVHAVETIVTQAATSFISEIHMRPVAKP
jgi:NAD(P)-dependent dehydrogenase (short-subunit alcohol dehydrogenase family)